MIELQIYTEPTRLLAEFPTLREYVAHRTFAGPRLSKDIAADMGITPSVLSRKLNPRAVDSNRLNLDNLEAWIASTGDAAAVVEYLAAKYLGTPA